MAEKSNKVASEIANIFKYVKRIDERVAWIYKEMKMGNFGGTKPFEKPVLEFSTIDKEYEGPFASFSKRKGTAEFSVIAPQELVENPHGTIQDEEDKTYLVVPVRTSKGVMYYIGIAEVDSEDRVWFEAQFGDNVGSNLTYCDDYKMLKTGKEEAPPTQEEKEIEEINREYEENSASLAEAMAKADEEPF